jgi:hypothetical protein
MYQFMRLSNIYFLLAAVVACTDYSPLAPFSSVAPLVFVLLVSMGREGVEDNRKRINDKETNAQKSLVLDRKSNKFENRRWD